MTSYLMKLVICPLGVIIASYLFPFVNYATLYQPIILGFILATVGVTMELFILRRGTVGLSTFLDFIASAVIIYFVSAMFNNTYVTIAGALLTSALLAIIEYATHRWLVYGTGTQKA